MAGDIKRRISVSQKRAPKVTTRKRPNREEIHHALTAIQARQNKQTTRTMQYVFGRFFSRPTQIFFKEVIQTNVYQEYGMLGEEAWNVRWPSTKNSLRTIVRQAEQAKREVYRVKRYFQGFANKIETEPENQDIASHIRHDFLAPLNYFSKYIQHVQNGARERIRAR